MHQARTIVTFKSVEFNTSEPKAYFLNRCSFGDDVCRSIMGQLGKRGVLASGPEQEDFAWFFSFTVDEGRYIFVVGYRPGDEDGEGLWIGEVERALGFLGRLTGRHKKAVASRAIAEINAAILAVTGITSVLWHEPERFRLGEETHGIELGP
jgi:hypothetical protein